MKEIDFLKKNSTLKESTEIGLEGFMGYYSNIDDSFITSDPKNIKWMMKLGITEQVQSFNGGSTSCIGFNPVEQKWYGWSHRAVFGFGIGSKVSKENCGYDPDNKGEWQAKTLEEAKEMAIDFAKSVG